MRDPELKPCPACGKPAEDSEYKPDFTRCSDDSGECYLSHAYVLRVKWNARRAPDAELLGLLREVREHNRWVQMEDGHYGWTHDLCDRIDAALAAREET